MPFSNVSPFSLHNSSPAVSEVVGAYSYDRNSTVKTSITQHVPTGTKRGHLMVAICAIDASGGGGGSAISSVPSGWTQAGGHATTTSNNQAICYFYKIADATDAAGGNTYTWTLGAPKDLGGSIIITLVFRDAQMARVNVAPARPVSDGAGNINGTFTYNRYCQGSLILGIMDDSANNVTAAGASATSGDYWNFWWGDNSGVNNALYIYRQNKSVVDSNMRVCSPRMSDTVTMSLTTSTGQASCWFSYIEILPSTAIQPTTPTIRSYNSTDYPSQSLTGGTTYAWVVPLPASRPAGDLMIAYLNLDTATDVGGWVNASGWTTIYTRTSTDPIHIAYKISNGSEPSSASFGLTINNSNTRTYNGHVQSFSIANGVYDTVGTAVTDTLGAAVNPSVTMTNPYGMAMAFVCSDALGNWSNSTMSDNSGGYELQTNTPGVAVYYKNDLPSGVFSAGAFTAGTGGSGATFGIMVSIGHA
jgi:hypothetical protein